MTHTCPRFHHVILVPTRSLLAAFVLLGAGAMPLQAAQQDAAELLREAREAMQQKKLPEAIALATRAIAAEPDRVQGYVMRAGLFQTTEQYTKAVADYDKAVTLAPEVADLFDRRGAAQFQAGNVAASISDFNKAIALRPEREPGHWQRGISFYYAAKYAEGQKQFEGYQTVDDNDVENAVWRFLCMARAQGVEQARATLLKIRNDRPVPMMEVYAMFAGKLKPDDVLAAATAGNPSPEQRNRRLFYAHLYIGLYYEAVGDKPGAKEHITKAARQHRIGHYMWDVARVHADMLQKAGKRSGG